MVPRELVDVALTVAGAFDLVEAAAAFEVGEVAAIQPEHVQARLARDAGRLVHPFDRHLRLTLGDQAAGNGMREDSSGLRLHVRHLVRLHNRLSRVFSLEGIPRFAATIAAVVDHEVLIKGAENERVKHPTGHASGGVAVFGLSVVLVVERRAGPQVFEA